MSHNHGHSIAHPERFFFVILSEAKDLLLTGYRKADPSLRSG
jgi:hypothetical protein